MVNESVYGSKDTWLSFTQDSTIKFANFGDNTGTIAKGFQTGKLKANKPYNNSVVHSSLGVESAISRIKTYKGAEELTSDSFNSTQWSFACGSTYFYEVDSTYTNNTENMLSPITNNYITNANILPIVDYDYKSIRTLITVIAQQTKTGGSSVTKSLHDYCENFSATYPYITAVYLNLYERINNNWVPFSVQGFKGLLIHNETTYFSKTRQTGKTFESGVIGSLVGATYGSAANVNRFIIVGKLNQRLGDNKIYKTDLNIVSGDVDVYNDGSRGHFFIEYYNGFEEYCKKQCACFGIQFVSDSQYINVDIESDETTEEELENIFIGVLDDNFVGHGNYVSGEKIKDTAQYKLDSANDSPFDPSKETDPNAYHNTSIKPVNVLSTTAFSTKYVMSFDTLQSIANQFYNALNGIPQDVSAMDYTTSLFLTNNALDTIVSCKYYPFNVDSTGNSVVQFGRYKTNVSTGQTNKKVVVYEFNCGSCFGEFGDFRDYEPYTTYELKIPFCASVRLNTAECVGKNISVSLAIDIETGSCTAFVYADNELIESVSGSCGVDIAISGIQQSTLDSQVFNASINNRQAKTNAQFTTAKGIISVGSSVVGLAKSKKSPVALTQGLQHTAQNVTNWLQAESDSKYSVERANYELSHVQVPYKCVGGVSSGVCLSESMLCVLIKETPVMLDEYNASVYGKTTGFACCINGTLSAFKGYTVCSDVDLTGINATENEKSMIKQILCTGVRL